MLNKAWLTYDPHTLEIKEIGWTKPSSNYIEIDPKLAIEFMTGKLLFSAFMLSKVNDEISLKKHQESEVKYTFTNLSRIDNSDLELRFFDNSIEIASHNANKFVLYCTHKENPSWLVYAWKLKNLPVVDNKIIINMEKVTNLSWFIGDAK